MQRAPIVLECGACRLVWEPVAPAGLLGFALEVRAPEGWSRVSASGNPLVCGASFGLLPAAAETVAPGRVEFATPPPAAGQAYEWSAAAWADAVTGWIGFEVVLRADAPFDLRMAGGFEPEITIDMGPLPPYERGDHVWFKTEVANPTRWNGEARGNDMPAFYYHDPYRLCEVMGFYDMTAMDWMGFGNIARFLNYRFGFRRRYRPYPAFELGMWADGYSGTKFPAGESRFRWFLRAAHLTGPISEHDAVKRLVACCLDLLPHSPTWGGPAMPWRELSAACARDLMDNEHCWGRDKQGEFPLNYVDSWAPAWKEALEAKGKPSPDAPAPCYDSAIWMVQPLAALARLGGEPVHGELHARIVRFCRDYLFERRGFVYREPQEVPDGVGGVWQYVYALQSTLQVGIHTGAEDILRLVKREVLEVLIPFAQRVQRVFPLCWSRLQQCKAGPGDNHGITGIYSLLMLDLHRLTGDALFLDEARAAMRVFGNLPIDAALQEVFLTAHGMQAACELAALGDEAEFVKIAHYLLAQTLRQMYWFSDRTTAATRDFDTLCSVHACTPILYPALFENVEALARLAACMRRLGITAPLLRVFDHARRNYQCFYPALLPAKYRRSAVPYVPLENIAILEGPEPAYVGQEIYGAGWTFRAHLMWDAFGRADDPGVMVLNLDTYSERELFESAKPVVSLVAFNPAAEPRRAEIELPFAYGGSCRVSPPNSTRADHELPLTDGSRAVIRLAPGEFRVLEVPIQIPKPRESKA